MQVNKTLFMATWSLFGHQLLLWGGNYYHPELYLFTLGQEMETLVDPSLNKKKNLPDMHAQIENNKEKKNIYIL